VDLPGAVLGTPYVRELPALDHVVSVATGMPVAAFNPSIAVAPPRDPAAALERVRTFYAPASPVR